MAVEHDFMRAVLRGDPRQGRFAWDEIIRHMRAVTSRSSRDSERLLRALLAHETEIVLDENSDGPHAMTPRDMLRADAIQTLARWNLPKHRAAIRAIAESTDSVSLEFVANDWLRGKGGKNRRRRKTRRR